MSPRSCSRGTAHRRAPAPVFAALGDETRLALVAKLCGGQPRSIAAPIGGPYTRGIIEEAESGTPDQGYPFDVEFLAPYGGVRFAVSQRLPVYVLDLNRPLLDRLIEARHSMNEVVQAVKRENLQVDRVFAMHQEPMAWSEVLALVEESKAL